MQLLQAGLSAAGVPSTLQRVALNEAGRFRSAFFTNSSTAVRLIAAIDDTELAVDRELETSLFECHDSNPLQPL